MVYIFVFLNANDEVSTVGATVARGAGEAFPVRVHFHGRADGDRDFYAEARAGGRGVFKLGGGSVACAELVLPGDFDHCHHGGSGLGSDCAHTVSLYRQELEVVQGGGRG